MFRRSSRSDRGASAVEFALVLLPLLIIVFGLIQYGLYFWSAQTGSNTVNAAARQLSVGNCQGAALQTFVDAKLGAAATAPATFDSGPKFKDADGDPVANITSALGGSVTLTIEFSTHNLNFPFVPFLDDPKVSRTVTARVEDTTDDGCPA